MAHSPERTNWVLFLATACTSLAPVTLSGCAGGAARTMWIRPFRNATAPAARTSPHEVRADPLAYLRRVAANCAALQSYRLTLIRTERRGFGPFRALYGPERIACWFRREPFSVRMKWLDEDVKYGESTYVAGRYGNKVRFRPRHGWFGLPPSTQYVDVGVPVIWGETLYPVTDFGLERLMQRTLESIEQTEGRYLLTYQGLGRLDPSGRLVHVIRIVFPEGVYPAPVEELYIDAKTDLPAGTRILTLSGRLVAAYVYDDVDTSVELRDEDFLLEAERSDSVRPSPVGAASVSERYPAGRRQQPLPHGHGSDRACALRSRHKAAPRRTPAAPR